MMLEHIRKLVQLIGETPSESIDVPSEYRDVSSIVISGMGGSGIAGDVVKDLMEDVIPKPIMVCRRLSLPAFAGKETLVVSMSYSGNTAETISTYQDAISRGCRVVGITGGGQLEQLFIKDRIPYAKLPVGYLPREAMPQMLALILDVFRKLGWVKGPLDLSELAARRSEIEESARDVAKKLRGKFVIVYTKYPSVAHRFKSQLNENSKTMAKYDIIPELAHNEINSWGSLGEEFHIVFMRDLNEPEVVTTMVEIMKKLLQKDQYTEVLAEGKDLPNRMLYLIWFGDFVSYYLALENKVDPERVWATELLKSGLAQAKETEASA